MEQFLKEKIEYNKKRINNLKVENEQLKKHLIKNKDTNSIEKWVNYKFQSSSVTTKEFKAFVRDFRKFIKANLPINSELISLDKGHFYLSGFIKRDNKFVYFSCSDVRGSNNEWYNSLLIRTAKHEKDFTGGSNNFIKLNNFKEKADKLLLFE